MYNRQKIHSTLGYKTPQQVEDEAIQVVLKKVQLFMPNVLTHRSQKLCVFELVDAETYSEKKKGSIAQAEDSRTNKFRESIC